MSETNKERKEKDLFYIYNDVFYVYKEKDDYYIHAEYLKNKPDGLHKITFHKILLPLFKDGPHTHVENLQMSIEPIRRIHVGDTYVNFGFGDLLVDPRYSVYTDELIKPGIKEMTICDIEKELGYPIKIIKENEND